MKVLESALLDVHFDLVYNLATMGVDASDTPNRKPDILGNSWETGCPYLGLRLDTDTRFGFPNTGNFCHRDGEPRAVNLDYQTGVCLSLSYEKCPIYQQQGDATAVAPAAVAGPVRLPAAVGAAAGAGMASGPSLMPEDEIAVFPNGSDDDDRGGAPFWLKFAMVAVLVMGAVVGGLLLYQTVFSSGGELPVIVGDPTETPILVLPTRTRTSTASPSPTIETTELPSPTETLEPTLVVTSAATLTPTAIIEATAMETLTATPFPTQPPPTAGNFPTATPPPANTATPPTTNEYSGSNEHGSTATYQHRSTAAYKYATSGPSD